MAFKKSDLKDQIAKEMKERALDKPKKKEKERMKIFPIRFPESDLLVLQEHFNELNQGLGTGIRRIVAEYMKKEGLK